MSWVDYGLARQYLLEKHIGTRIREAQQVEAAHAKSAAKALRRR